MIYTRFLMFIIIPLILLYYGMIAGQLFDLWKITNRNINFGNLCIPFYYWIVSQEPKSNNKKKTRNGKRKTDNQQR
jgi:hypothetical protein